MGYKLPLLFADGYPTSLDTITLKQIKRFLQFLITHTLKLEKKYKAIPNWWPKDIPFSVATTQPACDEAQWLRILIYIVIRCYDYYDYEILLELSEEYYRNRKDLSFEINDDDTSDMYSISKRQIFCTINNVHLLYDKEGEPNEPKSAKEDSNDIIKAFYCLVCKAKLISVIEIVGHQYSCTGCGRMEPNLDNSVLDECVNMYDNPNSPTSSNDSIQTVPFYSDNQCENYIDRNDEYLDVVNIDESRTNFNNLTSLSSDSEQMEPLPIIEQYQVKKTGKDKSLLSYGVGQNQLRFDDLGGPSRDIMQKTHVSGLDANVYTCQFCNLDCIPSFCTEKHKMLCEGFHESGVIFDSYHLDNNVVNVFLKHKMP